MRKVGAIVAAFILAGCGEVQPEGEPATLYRNSPLDPGLRVHFASFDAPDRGGFNLNNCGMAARILNANVDASAAAEGKERDPAVGFWCELGTYSQQGATPPPSFESEYPSTVRSEMRW